MSVWLSGPLGAVPSTGARCASTARSLMLVAPSAITVASETSTIPRSSLFRLVSRTEGPAGGRLRRCFPGPGPAPSEAELEAPAAAGQAACDGEQPQLEPLGLPAAGSPGEGEHLGPDQQLACQGDDLAPDLVLGETLPSAAGSAARCPGSVFPAAPR